MKELYTAPELEIVTFVPVEKLAYLEQYIRSIGATSLYADDEIDVQISGAEPVN